MKAHVPLKSQEKYTCQTATLLGEKKTNKQTTARSKRKKCQSSVKADDFGRTAAATWRARLIGQQEQLPGEQ